MTVAAKEPGKTRMNTTNLSTRIVIAAAMAASTLFASPTASQQSATAPASGEAAPHSWTTEQAVTSSVREAWAMGGKTEEGFFQIVQALTQISAEKRGITLPDNDEAGKKAGNWIKKQAKKDPDQLLYVIVDHAVQYSAHKTAAQQ